MPDEARVLLAFAVALVAAFVATPTAIAVATKTDFHDKPVGYKAHTRPTPYLGGAAVLIGFVLAAVTLGDDFARLWPIVACAAGLWVLGTLDDHASLSPWVRLAAEGAAGVALWSAGLGWDVFSSGAADLALTMAWTVGLVNAFNLMDNMDGVASTVGAVTAIAVGVLAATQDDAGLAALCFGLAGSCAGFLPYNLASPARIFLGDGGSLPVGFVIAAALMALPNGDVGGVAVFLAAVLLAGLPVLDTALVVVSRRRARVAVLTGGRDHLTHRLITRLGSPRAVALALGALQATLGAVAIGVFALGQGSIVAAWSIWFAVGAASVALLETRDWAPVRAAAEQQPRNNRGQASWPKTHRPPTPVEATIIVVISGVCGVSPFFSGFYDLSVWGPVALTLLALLLGLVVARPASPRRGALVAFGAIGSLWGWSLLSRAWAESADQALTDSNRYMLYATLFAVLLLLLRDDRLGRVVLGAATAAILGLAAYLTGRMLIGDGSGLFLLGRLNEPLGYVNGQAGYLLLGLWPLVAAAERIERRLIAAASVSGATLLVGLVLLSQTRAVVPAIVLSAVALLAVVPGRARRLWVLIVVGAGVLACLGPLLAPYDTSHATANPSSDVLTTAAGSLVLAAVGAGLVWLAAMSIPARLTSLPQPRSHQRVGAAIPFVIAGVAAVAVFVSVDDLGSRVEREFRGFVELRTDRSAAGGSRFISGAGNRYDYWRIAANEFTANPLRGVGAGNYDRTYFVERRTTEDVRQPHSLELQVLSELGLVGAFFLAAFLIPVLAGFFRRSLGRVDRGRDPFLAVAAGGMFLVWFIHTSVDWLHLIPGVTGIALCAAAVLVGPWSRQMAADRTRVRAGVVAGCVVLTVAGAVLIGRSALADRYLDAGREALERNPNRAIEQARHSLALNQSALPTYYLMAAANARLGRYRGARAALIEATQYEPHDFVPWTLLGDLAVRRGDRRLAVRYYRRASRLNPRDERLSRMAHVPPVL